MNEKENLSLWEAVQSISEKMMQDTDELVSESAVFRHAQEVSAKQREASEVGKKRASSRKKRKQAGP